MHDLRGRLVRPLFSPVSGFRAEASDAECAAAAAGELIRPGEVRTLQRASGMPCGPCRAAAQQSAAHPARAIRALASPLEWATRIAQKPDLTSIALSAGTSEAALEALVHAVTTNQFALPADGRVLFLRARDGHWWGGHSRANWICQQSFKPFAEALERSGLNVADPDDGRALPARPDLAAASA